MAGLLLIVPRPCRQMPDFTVMHTLSISRERITSAAFNSSGAWLALGCAKLGQLLVWEWKSESYVLKQQGHFFDIAACDFSPDGAYIATGADDCKVRAVPPSGRRRALRPSGSSARPGPTRCVARRRSRCGTCRAASAL